MADEMSRTTGFAQQNMDYAQRAQEQSMPGTHFAQQELHDVAKAVKCPHCGADNDADAMYCLSCGASLQLTACPNCGSNVDPDADFCEVCHSYIRRDVCSFCGAALNGQDAFCHNCGSPRGGIVCPTCHTLNEFSFCKQCGMALTDDARRLVEEIKAQPDYQELVRQAMEYNELEMQLPYDSDLDIMRERDCDALRERVLKLLAQDMGVTDVSIPPKVNNRVSKNVLNTRKAAVREKITQLLNKMAIPPQTKSATVRNYAMAQKPVGVRLAWQCNYKNAMHSSPCGCAKPHLGGKWVVLGHGTIKDDK